MKISRGFFTRDAENVARDLLGTIIFRRTSQNLMKGKIVETEAYLGETDPASWARYGKRKSNILMWGEAGKILVKNVHKHLMLNFVTGKIGSPQAVLIRAIEPLGFEGKCSGPGLLTEKFKILKSFNGKFIDSLQNLWLEKWEKAFEIEESRRIGVVKDLNKKLRFFIKGNKRVSKNGRRHNQ